ncbi:MAG: acetylxylan esterase [Bacteroidales bacterium]|jgi:hypothetical protein|nr:acetylxylan esterase [Bacteroidales bacterium]
MKRSILLLLILASLTANAQNDLLILKDKWLQYTDAQNSLYHYLSDQAFFMLQARKEKIAGLNTLAGWQQRQTQIKDILNDIVGPFPEKTPLNARIVRTVDKGSYRIEHIIFESQPRFYVTSSLYIPAGLKKQSRNPAIIYCSGHSAEGYRSTVYQHVILNLVKKGFIVFAFDPVGQGERLEYFDSKTGKSSVGGPTSEHSYPGAQAFLTGSSQARYMIWDGIRAVDYLLTRKEVDPSRIGITGRSGGGTQSAYIAAFDDRILAAAPENYLTSYTRLLQTIGPQDAEQNFFRFIFHGLDHPDFLIVRAPRPALMITTTGDMFSIQGAIETEKEVHRIYRAYGMEGNFSRAEDDAGHASTLKNREAIYAFFRKHLNNPGSSRDEETVPPSAEELRVTPAGQVSASLQGETVFSINLREAEKLRQVLDEKRKTPEKFLPDAVASARMLSGYIEPLTNSDPVFTGRIIRGEYSIEKYFIQGEGDYVIPYLVFKPAHPAGKAMIYLHPSGKSAEASAGGEIEKFVKKGITVYAPDLQGIGEMGPGTLRGDAYFRGVSHNLWYTSLLVGRSIVGILAGDLNRLAKTAREEEKSTLIIGYAKKEMASVLLHAAALGRDFDRVVIPEQYSSFMSIAVTRFYDPTLIMTSVPGALQKYDLPDLENSLPEGIFSSSGELE